MDASVLDPTILAMLAPFAAAAVAPLLVRAMGANAAWLLAVVPAGIFLHFGSFAASIARGEVITDGVPWFPALGVDFSWLIDGLSFTFALLVSGIGTLIVLYAGGYLKGHPDQGRFMSFILLFMGAMLGLVVADSFLMFFVYWELTSITSFLLIGFDHRREAARRAAIQALTVTGGGGLILLAGLFVIQGATGAGSLSELLATGDVLRESPLYLAAFLLVLGGAFTKSAQFPLHFWLPNAMEAPTPVSAYLHSATMVKAGVYLLMRLNPVMGETAAWETVLPVFGGTTLLVGTLLAVRQTDLKLMLAYTTVASLGLLVMLTGLGSGHYAIEAAVLYLVAHSLFKGGLFMVAGLVDHEAGTRDVTKLGGLYSAMPITFGAAVLGALSMGGLPPFFGFLAKEVMYESFGFEGWLLAFLIVAIIGNALMLVIGFAVAFLPFLGRRTETPKHAHEGPALMWLGPLTLGIVGLGAALLSDAFHAHISNPMATAVFGEATDIYIGPIPAYVNEALLLSITTVALGLILFFLLKPIRGVVARTLEAIGWGPDRGFDQVITGLVRGSVWVTGLIQRGKLEVYMTITFAVVAATLIVPLFVFDELPAMPEAPQLFAYEWAILVIAVVGCIAVLAAESRLTAIISLGIQGFAVALIFMLFGAPDLSFTQFMVETLSVVILALAMTRLRLSASDPRHKGEKLIDGTVALLCAVGFGLVLLGVVQTPFDASLSAFFIENSRPIAHGRNVVNVILVDYRGVDTFGEIAVVMGAGLAILALIRIRATAAKDAIPTPVETRVIATREPVTRVGMAAE